MSAPPRPPYRETAIAAGERRNVEALFAGQLFMAELEALERGRAYTRPGDPRGLCFTAQQWADYDEWEALWDRQEAKYGRFMPQMFASVRATMRTIR